jgi:hypothetical protein
LLLFCLWDMQCAGGHIGTSMGQSTLCSYQLPGLFKLYNLIDYTIIAPLNIFKVRFGSIHDVLHPILWVRETGSRTFEFVCFALFVSRSVKFKMAALISESLADWDPESVLPFCPFLYFRFSMLELPIWRVPRDLFCFMDDARQVAVRPSPTWWSYNELRSCPTRQSARDFCLFEAANKRWVE